MKLFSLAGSVRDVCIQVIAILVLFQGVAFAAIDASTSPSASVATTKTGAKKVAESHRGTIAIKSDASLGIEVVITLPIA